MWTKDDLKLVLKLWESKTTDEIAAELGVVPQMIHYVAKQIRLVDPKALPKKHRIGELQALIRDVFAKK